MLPRSCPDSLTIEPAAPVTLADGATQQLLAIGHYTNGTSVDLTTQVDWWEEAEPRLLAWPGTSKGLIQALRAGITKVTARYPVPVDPESDRYAEATIQVDRRTGRVQVVAACRWNPPGWPSGRAAGSTSRRSTRTAWPIRCTGSSRLRWQADPPTIAALDQGYLVARAEGTGTLRVGYEGLEQTVSFRVQGEALSKGVFSVQPADIDAVVDELFSLHVTTGSTAPVTAVSSDPAVVEVLGTTAQGLGYEVQLAARSAGQAEVTVTQGAQSQSVKVVVLEVPLVSLEFQPPVLTLHAGQPARADLQGTTADGRVIRVAPDRLRWEKQPQLQHVQLDRQALTLTPLAPTDLPQDLQVRLAGTDLVASGTLDVRGSELTPPDFLTAGPGRLPRSSARGRPPRSLRRSSQPRDCRACAAPADPVDAVRDVASSTCALAADRRGIPRRVAGPLAVGRRVPPDGRDGPGPERLADHSRGTTATLTSPAAAQRERRIRTVRRAEDRRSGATLPSPVHVVHVADNTLMHDSQLAIGRFYW